MSAEAFDHRLIRVGRGRLARVLDATQALGENVVVALWVGVIGVWSDEAVLFTRALGDYAIGAIETIERTPLDVARLRVDDFAEWNAPAIYALRWFEFAESDWTEFLELSEQAWPDFEAATPGTAVLGLFHAEPAKALLVTRYADLATWERSRGTEGSAGARFRRRAQITRRTVVRVYRPLVRS